ncbi:hypothetical protein R1A27_06530 [Methylobacterium sp. NMS12]|uniref:hypothetical protein n=1 Tax=Methylobacterium sp. NMS12 TaxID=3079766 RepID=UPI003F8850F9
MAFLAALTSAGPASALAAEPADLPALERVWHGCVREAFDRQPGQIGRAGRERNALGECKPHEKACVTYVVDPMKVWMKALRH